jgi:succinate-semialdehyde dehydrogenase/glutarate-semialdehyde dehydrogenase
MVSDAVDRGARLHSGGARIGNEGFFYAPTVLSHVPDDAVIMNEEPFGPVALINPVDGDEDAVTAANRLPYGLAAYAFTTNAKRINMLGREIESGMVGINTTMLGAADSPFGGMKWSGHGHEDGPEGLDACLVIKAVHEGVPQ